MTRRQAGKLARRHPKGRRFYPGRRSAFLHSPEENFRMLTHSNFITYEQNPETGLMEPVSPAQLWEETVGFTVPPEGLPAKFREGWQVMRKRLIAEGVAADTAWLRANEDAAQRQAKFREKSRKRFFRG